MPSVRNRTTVGDNRKTLGSCIAYGSLCVTIAMMLLIFILESDYRQIPSITAIVAFASIVIIGLVFCFPLKEFHPKPTVSETRFGMHHDDCVEHRISNMMETIRTANIQEVYIHRLRSNLLLQLSLMAVGMISLIAGAVAC